VGKSVTKKSRTFFPYKTNACRTEGKTSKRRTCPTFAGRLVTPQQELFRGTFSLVADVVQLCRRIKEPAAAAAELVRSLARSFVVVGTSAAALKSAR